MRDILTFFVSLTIMVSLGGLLGCGEDEQQAEPDATGEVQPSEDTLAEAVDMVGGDDSSPLDTIEDLVDDEALPEVLDSLGETGDQPLVSGDVTAAEEDGVVRLGNGLVAVTVSLAEGRFSLEGGDAPVVVDGATARVGFADGYDTTYVSLDELAPVTWEGRLYEGPLGTGLEVTVAGEGEGVGIEVSFVVLDAKGILLVRAEVSMADEGESLPLVRSLSPMVAEAETLGGLYMGADPSATVILDNGHDVMFDFISQVYTGGSTTDILYGPGAVSNWNAALHDPTSGASLVAGHLTLDRSFGLVVTDYKSSLAVEDDDGRKGFTLFETRCVFQPPSSFLGDGDVVGVASETVYLDLAPATAQEGLEAYGSAVATTYGKLLPSSVPTGWNSWGGGGGSGGYGTNIDEALILDNFGAMVETFAPYGQDYFLIDDGWEIMEGDWQIDESRFPPHDGVPGLAWLADQIEAAGLVPGIWIAPFWVRLDSQLYADHPDWMITPDPLMGVIIPSDTTALDLTHPEALQFVTDTITTLTQEWGYKWLKLDFGYYTLAGTDFYDPTMTAAEAYKQGLQTIRDAAGSDVFLLNVSGTGLAYSIADGERTTLDNMPWWGDPEKVGDQGIKVTVETAAHRYYLNHTVWINHPDLIFFRDQYGLTFQEARAFVTFVGISGGIVKLGESYLAMAEHPEWLDAVRPLLPVHGGTGRPLDLFERRYPEVWSLPLSSGGASCHVLGLFNWGLNHDMVADEDLGEFPRTHEVDLAALGYSGTVHAFSFWDRAYLGAFEGTFSTTLEPRTGHFVILKEELGHPRILATTRHFAGGMIEVHDEAWSQGTSTLSAELELVPGTEVQVFLTLSGMGAASAEAEGASVVAVEDGDVVVVTLAVEASPVTLSVSFAPAP